MHAHLSPDQTTLAYITPIQTTLAREDPTSIVFDGTLNKSSLAEVTWTSSRQKSIRASWTGTWLVRKSSEIIVEEKEVHELEACKRNSMWINVRQSVTIDREMAQTPQAVYTPYEAGSILTLDDVVMDRYPD